MFKGLIINIVNELYKSGLITYDNKEIYEFGIEATLLKFIHVLTMIIVGIFFGLVPQTILFIICYSAIRTYAGGIHAKTRVGCFIISLLMIILVLGIVKICPSEIIKPLSLILMLFSVVIILWLAPEDNPNKPLDADEIKHYKKIVNRLIIIEITGFIILWIANLQIYSLVISLSSISVSITLILRQLQKKHINISFQKVDR